MAPSSESSPARGGLRPLNFYLIVLLVFAADQVSKALILRNMAFGEQRQVLGSSFMLTLTQNTGGAWGLFPSGNNLFIAFAAAAIVALLFAYHRVARRDLLVASAFALALGGAIGNLLDRLHYHDANGSGYVVDFFDARIIHWPIFNIADSAISLGIVLLLIHYLRSARAESIARKASHGGVATLSTEELANNAHE